MRRCPAGKSGRIVGRITVKAVVRRRTGPEPAGTRRLEEGLTFSAWSRALAGGREVPKALDPERPPEEGRLVSFEGGCEEGSGDGVGEMETRGITADSVWSSREGVDEARGLKERGRNALSR